MKRPQAPKHPHVLTLHGDDRVDPYYWLKERQNPEVRAYLEQENAYADHLLSDVSDLRETLFSEMKARVREIDQSVPVLHGPYEYYSRFEAGQQYRIHCRKKCEEGAKEEILLDENQLAAEQTYFELEVFEVSPNHRYLAYSADYDGSERLVLNVKDLETGESLREKILNTSVSLAWTRDSAGFIYSKQDENLRPDRLYLHRLFTSDDEDKMIYKEFDPSFFVTCWLSEDEEVLFLGSYGSITTEFHFSSALIEELDFKCVRPREQGIEYSVSHHHHRLFLLINDEEQNFRLIERPLNDETPAFEWARGHHDRFLVSIHMFRDFFVMLERIKGLPQFRIVRWADKEEHLVDFDEATYGLYEAENPEFHSTKFRFMFSSLITPRTVYEYDMKERTKTVIRIDEVPGGYLRDDYHSERLVFRSHDDEEIPVSLVYRGGFVRDGTHPLLLYAYGSYGSNTDPIFSTSRLSLLDRGFAFAIAHVRGGSELGRNWYEEGKFLKKTNTFQDFIACAEGLIKAGYTSSDFLAIRGGSAGGLLVGAVLNMRPELFKAAVAHVPFVDVVTTMLDTSLPLTTIEYDEWGNPQDEIYYHYLKSYSPYDNIKRQAYPHLLITAGLNDMRVTYWEPAKWCAKIRELKTDNNLLILKTNMEAGHGGPSGRYELLKDLALEYAFILKAFTHPFSVRIDDE